MGEPEECQLDEDRVLMRYLPLYRAALTDDWETAEAIFNEDTKADTANITDSGKTTLQIAVGTNRSHHFVDKLVNRIVKKDKTKLRTLDMPINNSLHCAAIVGNTKAAKVLVKKDPEMTMIPNREGHAAVKLAAMYGRKETLVYLLEVTPNPGMDVTTSPYSGVAGGDLITLTITAGFYDIAFELITTYPSLVMEKDRNNLTALETLAAQPNDFPSGRSLWFWQYFIYSCTPLNNAAAINLGGTPSPMNSTVVIKVDCSPNSTETAREVFELDTPLDCTEVITEFMFNTPLNSIEQTDLGTPMNSTPVSIKVDSSPNSTETATEVFELDTPLDCTEEIIEFDTPQNNIELTDLGTPMNSTITVSIKVDSSPNSTETATKVFELDTPLDCTEEIEVYTPLNTTEVTKFETPSNTIKLTELDTPLNSTIKKKLDVNLSSEKSSSCIWMKNPCGKVCFGFYILISRVAQYLVPYLKNMHDTKLVHKQTMQLLKAMIIEILKQESHKKARDALGPAMFTAAKHGIHEIIEECLGRHPGLIWYDIDGIYLFLVAIKHRQVKVYNLVYQMTGHVVFLATNMDHEVADNALHLAGRKVSQHRLNTVTGAALQMQRELQWFKEIEKFVEPSYKDALNREHKTPQMVFTDEHKDLVEKGEKWMKDTASSSTLVAALIVTVSFAAIFTLPGVNKSDGTPNFLQDSTFVLFAISDAVALFSSVTSVLLFLAMLTSRYAEDAFLYALPKRLTIGLLSLFISILAIMLTFSAALVLVLRRKVSWIAIPVGLIACVPVTFYALLQFPLLVELVLSTYGPSIFHKQNNLILH